MNNGPGKSPEGSLTDAASAPLLPRPNKSNIRIWSLLFLGLPAIPVLILGASFAGFFPWSPVNCWHWDVDINSGRVRYTRHLFWMPIRQSVEDSALTKALRPDDLADGLPQWHRVVTLSPKWRNSPHYIFHGAMQQIRRLELTWLTADFTPGARRASAKCLLQLWQRAGNDDGARAYLSAVEKLAAFSEGKTNRISESDLPDWTSGVQGSSQATQANK